jgi:predicted HAD superfamily Cof-like phosphohydrolase
MPFPTEARFTGRGGYGLEAEFAAEQLTVGAVYMIRRLEIGFSRSYLTFWDFPDRQFNTTMFEPVPTPEHMLREFHAAAGLPLPGRPTAAPDLGSQTGRAAIVAEELRELAEAIEAGDIVAIADACADAVYGVIGTAVTYGIPFDAVFREVHESNMSKVQPGPPVIDGTCRKKDCPNFGGVWRDCPVPAGLAPEPGGA